ncbi:MAG: gliding motility-associated C-terminal domain-containing protein [Saprospirales bacterium]|nr:gliding motility-associated C-terminal domain-containing protein [Saprospirales bacterium]
MPSGILRVTALLITLVLPAFTLRAGCVDSIHLNVRPVQCHGLRNGVIEIAEVFGGIYPFYYSLDGQSFSTRPLFDLLWAGEYTLYVRDSTGCLEKYPVLVPEPEEIKVQISIIDTAVVSGEWFQIRAVVHPPDALLTAIEWRPPGLFAMPHELAQTVRIVEDTEFAIEIRNANNCVARDLLAVTVEKTNLYFPNAFSPSSNQDNYFTLFAGDGVSRIQVLQIFNRGGNLVYERRDFLPNDPLKGWNGRWHGHSAAAGVYAWVALVEFLDGKQRRFSGNVTLIPE